MRKSHMALLILVSLIGGSNFLAVKFSVMEIPPVFSSAMRFVISGVILIPFLKIQPGRMRQLVLTALNMGAFNFILIYIGFARAGDVSTVAIVSQAAVPFSTILAVLLLKEHVGVWRVTGIVVSLIGILVLGFDPRVFEYIDAVLLILAGVAAFSFGTIQMRKLGNVPTMVFMAWLSMIAAVAQFEQPFVVGPGADPPRPLQELERENLIVQVSPRSWRMDSTDAYLILLACHGDQWPEVGSALLQRYLRDRPPL